MNGRNQQGMELPPRLRELLDGIDFQPARILEEFADGRRRKDGRRRLRKVALSAARNRKGRFGLYLPVAPNGEPLKVGRGRDQRFAEPWLVVEAYYPLAETIGTIIFEVEVPDYETAKRLEKSLTLRLIEAGYLLPYSREPYAKEARNRIAGGVKRP